MQQSIYCKMDMLDKRGKQILNCLGGLVVLIHPLYGSYILFS